MKEKESWKEKKIDCESEQRKENKNLSKDSKINKKEEMKKNTKSHEKLIRGISKEYSSSCKQATRQAKK